MRNRVAILAALGVDNFGSGLFLPLALVYVIRVVKLPLDTAGALVSLGTVAGLAAPPVAGRLVDRTGPKSVVIISQLLQAAGAIAYLTARGAPTVLFAALLLAAGQQLFYSSLFTMISDAISGPRDRPFAIVIMVRSACFGLGGLAVAGVLTAAGPEALRVAVAADAVSFITCSALLAAFVRLPARIPGPPAPGEPDDHRVLADRPFLALIVSNGLIALALDFFLTGTPVYALQQLHAQPWLPGATLAVATILASTGGTLALRLTGRLTRLGALQLASMLYALWCAVSLSALAAPPGARAPVLLAATVVLAAASLVAGPRAVALAEEAAPARARGRYLAAFQYAYTGAGVIAPAVAAALSVAAWLPWALIASCAGAAVVGFRNLTGLTTRAAGAGPPGAGLAAAGPAAGSSGAEPADAEPSGTGAAAGPDDASANVPQAP